MDINERVNYYINNINTKNNFQKISTYLYLKDNELFIPNYLKILNFDLLLKQLNSVNKHKNFIVYGITLYNILMKIVTNDISLSSKLFLLRWGDANEDTDQNKNIINIPYFTKTRRINNKTGILLNFNYNRHWENIPKVRKQDIKFKDKIGKLVWRGTTTGEGNDEFSFENNRLLCIKKYYNHYKCNIGFSEVVQNVNIDSKYIKKSLKIFEQLKYKYILSIEGNDVASGLKWQLYSNSIVFMRKPKIVSWAMEDKLKPYIHYIPIKDDFSDCIEQISWCENNQDKCNEIIKNANNYIEQFLDKKKETIIHFLVLKKYFDLVNINK